MSDFRNVILIMTTNAGAAELAKQAIRLWQRHPHGARRGSDQPDVHAGIPGNRLDATISFAPLSADTIGSVVGKFILQLELQLADRNVTIELTQASARAWLAEKGYDPLYGARPLARIIQEHIKKPLAEELLFGHLAKGGIVRVKRDESEDKLAFTFHERPAPGWYRPKCPDVEPQEPALVE